MKKLPVFLLPVLCAVFLLAADQGKIPPLPVAVFEQRSRVTPERA